MTDKEKLKKQRTILQLLRKTVAQQSRLIQALRNDKTISSILLGDGSTVLGGACRMQESGIIDILFRKGLVPHRPGDTILRTDEQDAVPPYFVLGFKNIESIRAMQDKLSWCILHMQRHLVDPDYGKKETEAIEKRSRRKPSA